MISDQVLLIAAIKASIVLTDHVGNNDCIVVIEVKDSKGNSLGSSSCGIWSEEIYQRDKQKGA